MNDIRRFAVTLCIALAIGGTLRAETNIDWNVGGFVSGGHDSNIGLEPAATEVQSTFGSLRADGRFVLYNEKAYIVNVFAIAETSLANESSTFETSSFRALFTGSRIVGDSGSSGTKFRLGTSFGYTQQGADSRTFYDKSEVSGVLSVVFDKQSACDRNRVNFVYAREDYRLGSDLSDANLPADRSDDTWAAQVDWHWNAAQADCVSRLSGPQLLAANGVKSLFVEYRSTDGDGPGFQRDVESYRVLPYWSWSEWSSVGLELIWSDVEFDFGATQRDEDWTTAELRYDYLRVRSTGTKKKPSVRYFAAVRHEDVDDASGVFSFDRTLVVFGAGVRWHAEDTINDTPQTTTLGPGGSGPTRPRDPDMPPPS